MRRHPRIVRLDEIDFPVEERGDRYGWRRAQLGAAAGGDKLGCSGYEVPPGKRSWPYHYHLANEEAIYVLDGSALLRIGGEERRIAKGDYVALPVGPDGAHQVVNDGDAPVRYLCISTMIEPEVAVYPDSDKVAFFAGSAPGGSQAKRTRFTVLKAEPESGYWEGE